MKVLFRITLSKIRRRIKRSVFQAAAIFTSVFVASFFLCFVFSLNDFAVANPNFGIEEFGSESVLTIESLKSFFKEVVKSIGLIGTAVIIFSFGMTAINAGVGAEENNRFYGTLASIGATSSQRILISINETLLLYCVPILAGSFLGVIPATFITESVTSAFLIEHQASSVRLSIPLLISIIGIVEVLFSNRATFVRRKKPIIETVKNHNKKESGEAHSYRKSYTFRHMPIEKRIAKKSVAYHADAYRRITFMLVIATMYPLLSVIFFSMLSKIRIYDYTPGYGINVERLVEVFTEDLVILGILAFVALSAFGIIQTVYIIKSQNRVRQTAMNSYRSLGMTESKVKKVLKYEYLTAAFHALIYLAFIIALIITALNGI